MSARPPSQDSALRHPLVIAGLVCASLILTVAVVVWALASPRHDPVGIWLDGVAGYGPELALWRRGGPADPDPQWQDLQLQVLGGDAARGRDLIAAYGCGACHTVPGVTGADGSVGPSLTGFAHRAYIAGVLSNTPGDLTRWLVNPPVFAPDTAMPDMGVTDTEARDMAAYLYTLDQLR